MKRKSISALILFCTYFCTAQTNPVITSWLQNTSVLGTYYTQGNSTAVSNGIMVNCQAVEYSTNFVYISTTGVPAYPTGPFFGNPSGASDQSAIFKFPLTPTPNTGTATATTAGNIGVFINGVALFDYRDGVSWNPNTNSLCGGPGNSPCPGGMGTTQVWNRDAVIAERGGFDCSKAHPSNGNYHHHQNPSAFKNDLVVLSTICNLYDADGLYTMDNTAHSPLLGFAYDGYPIYGAYGYKNADGTGGIERIKSSYQLATYSVRTHYPNGTDVADGPAVSTTYPLGYFREDYYYVAQTEEDYLDEHNGRFCVTPEYPEGVYCYFATVDTNLNSAYPYIVGPTFYGNYTNGRVTSISESTTVYNVALPVALINFNGTLADNNGLLHWETVSEINSSHFELERSQDGENFAMLTHMEAKGNTSNTSVYDFIDYNIPSGRLYYRLKQVDMDGRFEYSNIIKLKLDSEKTVFSILPNPATDLLVIQFQGLLDQHTYLGLYDMEGRLVQQTQINQGQTMAYFDVETLYAGNYILKIVNHNRSESHKIIIQH